MQGRDEEARYTSIPLCCHFIRYFDNKKKNHKLLISDPCVSRSNFVLMGNVARMKYVIGNKSIQS